MMATLSKSTIQRSPGRFYDLEMDGLTDELNCGAYQIIFKNG
jgi:hypothetical protein